MKLRKKLFATIGCLLGTCMISSCANLNSIFQTPKTVEIELSLPQGEAFPYISAAQEYLEAGAGANVRQYMVAVDNPNKAITVKWSCDSEDVATYKVSYATQENGTDSIVVTCDKGTNSVDLYNLYKATTYYVTVEAQNEKGENLATEKGTFTTTDLGPRVMLIPDIHNVRDVGGYKTVNGKTTKQGLIYRGGTLRPADVYSSNLTAEGANYMAKTLGVKTEIDFRGTQEAGGLTESVIPGANLVYATLSGYSDAFTGPEGYRQTFAMLSDINNYPIYYHCTGGADRTGTVTYLLNILLGVSETECIQDYEFTTFSYYSERNSQQGVYSKYFIPFRQQLETYEGDTLQEKVENFLLSIGVTKEQIANIKAIMYGEIAIK